MAAALSVRERLDRLFKQRIVIFDGSMGVMLQHKGLSDADFRGERFRHHYREIFGERRHDDDVGPLEHPLLLLAANIAEHCDLIAQRQPIDLATNLRLVVTRTATGDRE